MPNVFAEHSLRHWFKTFVCNMSVRQKPATKTGAQKVKSENMHVNFYKVKDPEKEIIHTI